MQSFNVPDAVALPFPALLGILSAIPRTLIVCLVFGLFVLALRGFRSKPWLPPSIGIAALFFATLDSSANLKQTPLMLITAAATAILAFIVVRYVFGTNLLAYPLTIAVALLAGNGADLLQNHRSDLRLNGTIEIVVAVALLLWAALPNPLTTEAQRAQSEAIPP